MSTSSVSHSIELDDDVLAAAAAASTTQKPIKHKKYATLEKCNSLIHLNGNLTALARSATATTVNFEWYKQFQRNARTQMMKSKSIDANTAINRSASTMQYNKSNCNNHSNNSNDNNHGMINNKSVNRDGTIARNHFRGVPGNFLDKHTKHFLLSMTVSIAYASYMTHRHKNTRT